MQKCIKEYHYLMKNTVNKKDINVNINEKLKNNIR